MRLTKNEDIENAKRTMDVYISGAKEDYINHPSYSQFLAAMGSGFDATTAKNLWTLLMEGLREKYECETEDKLESFAAEAGANELLSTGTDELALWTGGFDMSRIAQLLGYCTLEKTIMGKALDTIAITSLWSCECKMWNALSRQFVKGYHKDKAHIYFRIMDETSVLEKQEVPQLREQECNKIYWHPVYYNGSKASGLLNQYSEVGIDGRAINISDKNAGFSDQKKAGEALQEKIRAYPFKYNEKSFLHANSSFFDPKRVPFALYD